MVKKRRTSMNEGIVIALGGNAILRHREVGTAEEQMTNVIETCEHLVRLVSRGSKIAITHGNGPQVGDILLQNDLAKGVLPPMPLDVCDAESQGMIGYMIQQSMDTVMKHAGIRTPVVTLLTQVVVDASDRAFGQPEKPIGPFYTAMEAARLRVEKGWQIVNDSGRGYRRVVPSPEPIEIIEQDAIKALYKSGTIVIACGGGGIPVVLRPDGTIQGVEAVIDKDHSATLLATAVGAEILLILTDVDHAYLNFQTQNQVALTHITAAEAQEHLKEGHFAPGSMGPKITSAIRFLQEGGKSAIITTPALSLAALDGGAGTTIIP
jgi:carbamate kinase